MRAEPAAQTLYPTAPASQTGSPSLAMLVTKEQLGLRRGGGGGGQRALLNAWL